GKTIVSTTTNGTRAFRACAGAKTIVAGSFLNLTATAVFLREKKISDVLLVCAGTRESAALEDVLAAGAMCDLLSSDPESLSDAAQTAFHAFVAVRDDLALAVSDSRNARRVASIPELQADVAYCLQSDIYPFVAAMDREGVLRAL
ncbi:MAG TPA: 2-phosphosulfolactate phosphatase, partial [Desulfuromonadaceae bacterium]|nr:2-phosphosulfolactate phosphatase [Desulfuromonadaceae bacterium]